MLRLVGFGVLGAVDTGNILFFRGARSRCFYDRCFYGGWFYDLGGNMMSRLWFADKAINCPALVDKVLATGFWRGLDTAFTNNSASDGVVLLPVQFDDVVLTHSFVVTL